MRFMILLNASSLMLSLMTCIINFFAGCKRKLTKHKKLSNNTLIEIDHCSPLELFQLQTNLTKGEGIIFQAGKGKRISEIQQFYEKIEACGQRLLSIKNALRLWVPTGTVIRKGM